MPHNCKTRFYIDTSDGDLRINCSCGWTWKGEPASVPEHMELIAKVQNHRPPLTKEPPLKVEGFVSGLPERWP